MVACTLWVGMLDPLGMLNPFGWGCWILWVGRWGRLDPPTTKALACQPLADKNAHTITIPFYPILRMHIPLLYLSIRYQECPYHTPYIQVYLLILHHVRVLHTPKHTQSPEDHVLLKYHNFPQRTTSVDHHFEKNLSWTHYLCVPDRPTHPTEIGRDGFYS